MSGSLNHVILIGNVGRDPEIRSLQNGNQVANLSLATSESWTDKDGNKQKKTEWHRITIWKPGLVKVIENYVGKGSAISIIGQIETRKWTDKDGNDRYTTEIVVRAPQHQLVILSWKDGAGGQPSQDDNIGGEPIDDDIPF